MVETTELLQDLGVIGIVLQDPFVRPFRLVALQELLDERPIGAHC